MRNAATFTTARPRLVSRLMDAGFQPLSVGKSPWNPAYSVWTFARTPELDALVGAFYDELKVENSSQIGGVADGRQPT